MRVCTLTLTVLLALTACAAPAAAAETEVGSVAVKGGPMETATSEILLKAGVQYRLVVSGTSTVTFGSDSTSYDALYCFASSASDQCKEPFPEGSAFSLGLKSGSAEPSTENFVYFTGRTSWPAYDGGHSYSGSFTPSTNGYLFLKSWPGYYAQEGVSRNGGFTVKIYSADAGACPLIEKPSGREGCDYRALWDARLEAKPSGQHGAGSVSRVEVRGSGELLFGKPPKKEVIAFPEPEGFLTFVTRHRAHPNINGGRPWATKYRMEFRSAQVKYSKTFRSIQFTARIVKLTSRAEVACGIGDIGRVTVIQRAGKVTDEMTVEFKHGPATCLSFSGRGTAVKVTVGTPAKL